MSSSPFSILRRNPTTLRSTRKPTTLWAEEAYDLSDFKDCG